MSYTRFLLPFPDGFATNLGATRPKGGMDTSRTSDEHQKVAGPPAGSHDRRPPQAPPRGIAGARFDKITDDSGPSIRCSAARGGYQSAGAAASRDATETRGIDGRRSGRAPAPRRTFLSP